jgi:hypothetical protein
MLNSKTSKLLTLLRIVLFRNCSVVGLLVPRVLEAVFLRGNRQQAAGSCCCWGEVASLILAMKAGGRDTRP